MRRNPLGIYEKALPPGLSWPERLDLAKACGFDFVEISIDETDARLARLDWSIEERMRITRAMLETGIRIPTMCLSGHRRFPLGSHDAAIRKQARDIMDKAIRLAQDIGIRTIQLAGYDVYYEEQDASTLQYFEDNLKWAVERAAAAQVMIGVEIMDTRFMSSISRWLEWDARIRSPWFTVYPDVGNLSAWNDNVDEELQKGIDKTSAIHLKDTLKVTADCPGQFRDVPFGKGCVDFVTVFRKLKALNYRGTFLIEMWTEKSDSPVEELINARRWIERRMQEAVWPT